MSNRDMGDEHVDRLIVYPYPDISCVCHGAAAASLCDRDCNAIGYTVDPDPVHRYPCSSDQYTDTHVYAHGDAGDRAGE